MDREKDEIWEALTEGMGEVRTKSERGRRNRAVAELREAGVSREEILAAVDFCRARFSHFTEIAVCGWLSRALQERERGAEVKEFFKLIRGGGAG